MNKHNLSIKAALNSQTKSKRQLLRKIDIVKKMIQEYSNSRIDNILSKDYSELKNNRLVEKPEKVYSEMVFTTYFTSKPNPQKVTEKALDNDIKYILPWYNSVNKQKIQGIVFYDELTKEFINEFSTEYVQFVKCELGNYSLNDERFIIYYMFILEHVNKIKALFMTDASDVIIQSSPFSFINNYNENVLFVGRNNGNLRRQRKINRNKTLLLEREMKKNIEQNFYNLPIYNAGILGGKTPVALYFLRQLTHLFLRCDSHKNLNMAAFNYIIYLYWYPKINSPVRRLVGSNFNIELYKKVNKKIEKNKILSKLFFTMYKRKLDHDNKNDMFANSKFIVTSYPLCSAFKKYEKETDTDAVFIHK